MKVGLIFCAVFAATYALAMGLIVPFGRFIVVETGFDPKTLGAIVNVAGAFLGFHIASHKTIPAQVYGAPKAGLYILARRNVKIPTVLACAVFAMATDLTIHQLGSIYLQGEPLPFPGLGRIVGMIGVYGVFGYFLFDCFGPQAGRTTIGSILKRNAQTNRMR